MVKALRTATVCIALWLGGTAGSHATDGAFEARVRDAMAYWHVPGLAVAAIRGDRVVYQQTFGVADVDSGRPVTAKTLFAVGSITKSFTATALAALAGDRTFDWDRPVVDYLPDFRLMDPSTTRAVTVRDLASHRTGMPRHDVLWYAKAFDRGEMIRRLRFLPPTRPLRQNFQYNNLMFMVAGRVAGRIAGGSWEDVVESRILRPLGMASTVLGFIRFLSSPEAASPYFGAREGRVPIAARNTDEIGPAASVYSTIEDMARYARLHLNGGATGGVRIMPAAQSAEMMTPQIRISDSNRFEELGPIDYGLGFYLSTYRGERYVYHPGFIDGYGALLALLPDRSVGAVVLTNLSGHDPVPKMVVAMLFDRLLGLAPLPWVERYRDIEEARRHRREELEERQAAAAEAYSEEDFDNDYDDRSAAAPVDDDATLTPSAAPRPAGDYAGTYAHPGYGPIQIWADASVLGGRFHQWVFPLVRVAGDVWRLPDTVWPLRGGLRFTFVPGADGRIVRLETPLADGPTYPFKVGPLPFDRQSGSESISGR